MPIKLNGATSGSIELNVPDSIGSDLNITIPSTAGEVAVKRTDGHILLNGATFSQNVTVDQAQLNIQLSDGNGNQDEVVIGSSGSDVDRSRIKVIDGSSSQARDTVFQVNGRGRVVAWDNIQAGIRRDADVDSPSGSTFNTDEFASGLYAYQGSTSDDTTASSVCWMRTHTSDTDRWMFNLGSSNDPATTYSSTDADHVNFWVNGRGLFGTGGTAQYIGRIRSDANTPVNNYSDITGSSVNLYASDGGTSYDTVTYVASYQNPATTNYSFLSRRGTDDFRVRATDGRIYSDYGASVTNMDYAEYFEWNDGNPNNDDRVGHSVVLVDGKIRIATTDDNVEDIIGIVSKEPAVVGDAAEMRWTQKFLKDEFGNTIYHDEEFVAWNNAPDDEQPTSFADVKKAENCASKARFEQQLANGKLPEYVRNQGFHFTDKVATLNPDYDPDRQYVPREQRSEWEAIGLVGKLWLKPDQPVNPRWKLLKTGPTGNQRWLIR